MRSRPELASARSASSSALRDTIEVLRLLAIVFYFGADQRIVGRAFEFHAPARVGFFGFQPDIEFERRAWRGFGGSAGSDRRFHGLGYSGRDRIGAALFEQLQRPVKGNLGMLDRDGLGLGD